MLRRFILALAFAASLFGQTTVTDIIYNGAGQRANGIIIYIRPNQQFTASGGQVVAPTEIPVRIVNGVFTVALYPNTTATPAGTYYLARYVIPGTAPVTESWIVPTGGPVNLSAVRTVTPPSTSFVIALSQIGQGGANPADCLIWSGSSWQPSASCGGVGSNPLFSQILTATNTTAVMTVGSGAQFLYTGTGIINANRILGINLTTLATGLVKVTTGTGALSTAVLGTDYQAPIGASSPLSISGGVTVQCLLCTTGASLTSGQLLGGTGGQGLGVVNLSGDATTANSTAVIVKALNGVSLGGLATGLLKNTTSTGVPSIAVAADITGLFSGCSGVQYLGADGACHAAGGTVSTIVGPSWLTWTLVTGTYTATPTTGQTSHQVIGTCNAATTFAPCALVAGDLPNAGVFTGDVASTFPAVTVSPGAITLAKMANLAANSILGNNTGSPATPLALTATQVTAFLNPVTTSLQGVAPASGGGTSNYLRADGTWNTPPGTGAPATMTYCADASGSTTTYTCTPSPALGGYAAGLVITFVPQTSNTAGSTVNVSSLGAKSILAANTTGSALVANDLLAGGVYTLEYDGTNFRKVSGPDGAWTALTYSNSWGDFGSGNQVGQFRKSSNGDVCIRGLLALGTLTAATTMATLPAGYRPTSTQVLLTMTNNSTIDGQFAEINVTTAGLLQYEGLSGANTALFINGNTCFSVY